MRTIKEMPYLELNGLTQKTRVLGLGTGLGIFHLISHFDSQSPFFFSFFFFYKESTNLKEMRMWEWINYCISDLKIQKQSSHKCSDSIKGTAFNHSLPFPNTTSKGCGELRFPNCSFSSWAKFGGIKRQCSIYVFHT